MQTVTLFDLAMIRGLCLGHGELCAALLVYAGQFEDMLIGTLIYSTLIRCEKKETNFLTEREDVAFLLY